MWGSADPEDLEQAWAEELWPYDAVDLRDALAAVGPNYRDYPPTLPQFVGLCRDAKARRVQSTAKINAPHVKADPEFVARIIESAGRIGKPKDRKAWAKAILREAAAGTYKTLYGIECAREVLGLPAGHIEHEVVGERMREPGEEG